MKKTVSIFLKDRISWILFLLIQIGIQYLWIGLSLYFDLFHSLPIYNVIGYGFLISLGCLILFLIYQWIRWYSYGRMLTSDALNSQSSHWFASWQSPDSGERQVTAEVIKHLYQLGVQERKQFQQAHQQQLEFINLWVHQMKTPISAIHLIMQRSNPASAAERERWNEIEGELDKLNHGLDLSLSMARLSDFSVDYLVQPVDLLSMLRELINEHKKTWIRYHIFPRIEAAEQEWLVYTDPKWNRFILEQIIYNAIKYTSQVKPQSDLMISLQRDEKWIRLEVKDQGPGIPSQDLPRLFEPFFTGENGRQFASATGMGLYLVKKVTEELGHTIEVTSEVGEGSIFTIKYMVISQI